MGKIHGPGVGNLVKNFGPGVPNPRGCPGGGMWGNELNGALARNITRDARAKIKMLSHNKLTKKAMSKTLHDTNLIL